MQASIIKSKLKTLAILLFWMGIWYLAYRMIGRDIYVPSPFRVFARLMTMVVTTEFWVVVAMSVYRVIMGLLIAVILGVFLGVLAGINPLCHDVMHPFIAVVKSTPVISFIIIALIWFQSSHVPIFIGLLMCFPIIWTNVVTGIWQVDAKLLQMGKTYGFHKKQLLQHIYIPSMSPYLSAALVTALGIGWKVSVAAEVLAHPRQAIGSHLHSAKAYLDTESLFAWTVVIVLLSLLFESVFKQWVQGKKGANR